MGKQPGRRKHVPQRTCIACRTVRPKRDLVRVVRTPDGTVMVDETGKHSGRGAYLCRRRGCWEMAMKGKRLEQALQVTLTAGAKEQLRTYLAGLAEPLPTGSEDEKDDCIPVVGERGK
jgi:predicted RNA-binding protein YlxR (DUF448 family)